MRGWAASSRMIFDFCRFQEIPDQETREKIGYLDLPLMGKLGFVVPKNTAIT